MKNDFVQQASMLLLHIIKTVTCILDDGMIHLSISEIPGTLCNIIRLLLLYVAVFILDRI